LRIQYQGAIYHLMSRGDRREEIFRDDLFANNASLYVKTEADSILFPFFSWENPSSRDAAWEIHPVMPLHVAQ
jgi:hypothetical protein